MSVGEQGTFIFEEPKILGHLSLRRPLVFFDLETTGIDPVHDRIVQFAFLRVNPDRSTDVWVELVNPGIPIPIEASKIHHITDQMVQDKPAFAEFAFKVKEFLAGCDLAGFNIQRFDVPFVAAEMQRNAESLDLQQLKIIDVQTIFHKHEPRDLAAAYRFYCGKQHENAHDALHDVQVTLEVLDAQLARYADLPHEVKALHNYCRPSDDRWVTLDRKFYWRNNEAVISFGKHKGKSLQWICENDPNYLTWIQGNDFSEETRAIIAEALKGNFPGK
jgi:DNA polymerase III subunit epsilon